MSGMADLGLTVGDLRLLWRDLPDDVLLDVSFGSTNNLVVTYASIDPTTPGAHLTVGPITRDAIKVMLDALP